jgi:hypothetical protein
MASHESCPMHERDISDLYVILRLPIHLYPPKYGCDLGCGQAHSEICGPDRMHCNPLPRNSDLFMASSVLLNWVWYHTAEALVFMCTDTVALCFEKQLTGLSTLP